MVIQRLCSSELLTDTLLYLCKNAANNKNVAVTKTIILIMTITSTLTTTTKPSTLMMVLLKMKIIAITGIQ